MTIIQGNRESIEVNHGNYKSYYIHKINGEYYDGKHYRYFKCSNCGQLICHMMGGAKRHFKMCDKKTSNETNGL